MQTTVPPSLDDAVRKSFLRVLELTKLPLCARSEGIYEIPSDHTGVRIRWQVSHSGYSILVTLSPHSRWSATLFAGNREIGLANVIEFYGDAVLERRIASKTNRCEGTAAEIMEVLALCASAVEKYCIPLLLGLNDDWPEIERFVEEKIHKSHLEGKKWRFPPSVKRKWKKE